MRKLMFLALGAIVGLSFTACGNKQGQTSAMTDTTLVDSSKIKDVTVYGLCGENAAMNSLEEGSIIEISVKSPEGRELCTNLRVNGEDMQLLREIQAMNVNP